MSHLPFFREYALNRFPYMFAPNQLMALCHCLDQARDVPGIFVEVGCAYGHTTVFLKHYMQSIGLTRRYIALDTFAGFVAEHVSYEVHERRKSPRPYRESFAMNSKALFDRAMLWNGLEDVESVQCDVTRFIFNEPIAFCLLDVDLYLPIKEVLPRIYDALSPGGMLLVDDCTRADERWDGALEAFEEFVLERKLPRTVLAGKLGFIKKA